MADDLSLDLGAVERIRKRFPILDRKVQGHDLVYLDSAASAQKPREVTDRMAEVAHAHYANVHRGLHTLANEATEIFEGARHRVRKFLNAAHDEEIVFTGGATDAINIVAAGIAASIRPGDEIVLPVFEHHANIVPWHFLRTRRGAVLRWVEPDRDGRLPPDRIAEAISPRTRMIAVSHMSNVLGTVADIAGIAACAHDAGAEILVDGCQAAAHLDVDVCALGADYYVFSGHKVYGPTGIGVLYARSDRLAALEPFRGGGEMIDIVTRDDVSYRAPPHRFEAGTPPILEAAGLEAAIDFVDSLDRAAVAQREDALRRRAVEGVRALGFTVHGPHDHDAGPETIGPLVSFGRADLHPHDIAQLLDPRGIAIRAGHHCAQPLMEHLGVPATARVGLAAYNTDAEISIFLSALDKACKLLED